MILTIQSLKFCPNKASVEKRKMQELNVDTGQADLQETLYVNS